MQLTMTINGQGVLGKESFAVLNPATEQLIAQCPEADPEQINLAVSSAHKAFETWRQTSIEQRRELLYSAAKIILAHREELASLLTQEQGKPLSNALEEIESAAEELQNVAKISIPNVILQDDSQARVEVRHKPIGVVAAIVPWNYPIYIAMTNLGMTLLAGNTIIIKPSPFTPLTTLRLGEMLREVIPPGVVNIIGGGDKTGAQLIQHPGVNKITFTGSVATGKKIAQVAAKNLTPVTLELGGNDAAIVLPDADVKKIAEPIFWGAFTNAGQICIAIKRLYVHEKIMAPLVDELKKIAESIKVGDGLDPETQMGPLNNPMQLRRIKTLVADAKRLGGKIITGGKALKKKRLFLSTHFADGCERRNAHCR